MTKKTIRRLVVKVGTSTLTYATGNINFRRLGRLVETLSDVANSGVQVVLVSSGAIAVGVGKLGLPARPADIPGRQAAAAFALGACGAQIGTCLLVSQECPIHDNYKQALLKAKDSDTTVTGRSVGAPVRVLKNQMTREYLAREKAGADKMELEKYTLGSLRRAVFDGDTKTGSLMAGQVAGMLHEVRPLRTILEELCADCRSTALQLAQEV